MTKLGEVCIHGGLRRKCETCDLADERDELLAQVAALTAERDAARKERNERLRAACEGKTP